MAYWQADHLIILKWLRNTQLDDVILKHGVKSHGMYAERVQLLKLKTENISIPRAMAVIIIVAAATEPPRQVSACQVARFDF